MNSVNKSNDALGQTAKDAHQYGSLQGVALIFFLNPNNGF